MWHPRCFILLLSAVQLLLLLPCSAGTSDWELQVDPTKLTCPSFFQKVGDQCLFFSFMSPTNYKSAKQFCDGLQASLLVIKSAPQFETIIDFIYSQEYESSFWVDGSDLNHEGEWKDSNKNPVVMDTPFWLTSESVYKPSDNATTNCIALETTYSFFMNDVDCESNHNALCEYPMTLGVDESVEEEIAPVECPLFFVDVGGTCLAFVIWEEVTWEEANIPCIGMEGELAILDNVQQLRDIYEYLHKHEIYQHSFWIGGSDAVTEGKWLWIDQTNVTMGSPWWGFSNDVSPGWGFSYNGTDSWSQEPDGGADENCLALTSEGHHYLRDKDCAELFSPLCMLSRK